MTEARPAKAGRQTLDGVAVRRVQVTLDEETIDRARVLGDGNLSQGIRQAIASLPTPTRQTERGMMAAQTTKGKKMNTLTNEDCRRILAAISGSDADPIHATAQAVEFFRACREQDDEWPQYAANPDLAAALGGVTADVFLGWRE